MTRSEARYVLVRQANALRDRGYDDASLMDEAINVLCPEPKDATATPEVELAATRLLVDTAFGMLGVPDVLQVVPAQRSNGDLVLLLCEIESGSATPLAELHPPSHDYEEAT